VQVALVFFCFSLASLPLSLSLVLSLRFRAHLRRGWVESDDVWACGESTTESPGRQADGCLLASVRCVFLSSFLSNFPDHFVHTYIATLDGVGYHRLRVASCFVLFCLLLFSLDNQQKGDGAFYLKELNFFIFGVRFEG